MAGALSRLGVEPGDRVAVVMATRSEWMESWFGICALGAIEVAINHGLKGALLAHCLADSGASIAIVEDQFLDEVMRLHERLPSLRTVVVVGEQGRTTRPVRLIGFNDLPRTLIALPATHLGTPACIMYTSGTTGNAKGVVLPHNYFLHFGEVKAAHMRTTESDRIYNVYPMFNASAQLEAVMAAMAVGATVVHAPRFSASAFWDDIRMHRCTEFVYMGGILSILAKAAPRDNDADNPIRAAYGVPTPVDLHRPFEQRFGLKLVELYGTTETGINTLNPYDERRVGSCGLPTCGYDVRVVDEYDNDVELGEAGEIIVRPNVPYSTMIEYRNLPDRTVQSWRGSWYRSGDLARMDADGYIFFVGRKAEAIRHRGYMVNPTHIEAVLVEHGDILECAVHGLADAERGEDDIKVCLVPTRSGNIDLEDLIELARRELPAWMVPRYWQVRDSIPKTPTEKFAKAQLRAEGITADTIDITTHGRPAK